MSVLLKKMKLKTLLAEAICVIIRESTKTIPSRPTDQGTSNLFPKIVWIPYYTPLK